jgi:hypothetical protein
LYVHSFWILIPKDNLSPCYITRTERTAHPRIPCLQLQLVR